jgi:hypothetical protein
VDGVFRLEEIDATGKITRGFHDLSVPLGAPPISIPLSEGQVVRIAGLGYSVVMEHLDYLSTRSKRRYEGVMAFDSNPTEDRLVIVAIKTRYMAFAPAISSTEVEAAAVPLTPQEDGTVIITRP